MMHQLMDIIDKQLTEPEVAQKTLTTMQENNSQVVQNILTTGSSLNTLEMPHWN